MFWYLFRFIAFICLLCGFFVNSPTILGQPTQQQSSKQPNKAIIQSDSSSSIIKSSQQIITFEDVDPITPINGNKYIDKGVRFVTKDGTLYSPPPFPGLGISNRLGNSEPPCKGTIYIYFIDPKNPSRSRLEDNISFDIIADCIVKVVWYDINFKQIDYFTYTGVPTLRPIIKNIKIPGKVAGISLSYDTQLFECPLCGYTIDNLIFGLNEPIKYDTTILGQKVKVTISDKIPQNEQVLIKQKTDEASAIINNFANQLSADQKDTIRNIKEINIKSEMEIKRSFTSEANGIFYVIKTDIFHNTQPTLPTSTFYASNIAHEGYHVYLFKQGGIAMSRGAVAEMESGKFQAQIGEIIKLSPDGIKYLIDFSTTGGTRYKEPIE